MPLARLLATTPHPHPRLRGRGAFPHTQPRPHPQPHPSTASASLLTRCCSPPSVTPWRSACTSPSSSRCRPRSRGSEPETAGSTQIKSIYVSRRRPLVSPPAVLQPCTPGADPGPPHHTLLMPRKPIICTECGADRANKTWQQSGNQFAALLLVDDEAPPKPPRTPAADVCPARDQHDRDSKPSAAKSSKDGSH